MNAKILKAKVTILAPFEIKSQNATYTILSMERNTIIGKVSFGGEEADMSITLSRGISKNHSLVLIHDHIHDILSHTKVIQDDVNLILDSIEEASEEIGEYKILEADVLKDEEEALTKKINLLEEKRNEIKSKIETLLGR